MGLLSRPERELCSVGVPPAVTGASRSRQGAGRMPINANRTRPGVSTIRLFPMPRRSYRISDWPNGLIGALDDHRAAISAHGLSGP
jgi:hypothetical protein